MSSRLRYISRTSTTFQIAEISNDFEFPIKFSKEEYAVLKYSSPSAEAGSEESVTEKFRVGVMLYILRIQKGFLNLGAHDDETRRNHKIRESLVEKIEEKLVDLGYPWEYGLKKRCYKP